MQCGWQAFSSMSSVAGQTAAVGQRQGLGAASSTVIALACLSNESRAAVSAFISPRVCSEVAAAHSYSLFVPL